MLGADEGLKLGADVTLVALLLSIILFIASSLSALYNNLNYQNMQNINKYVNEFAAYDHKSVKGDIVQQFVKKYADFMFVRIATEKTPTGIYGKNLKGVTNIESASYVNPVSSYYGVMLRDSNGDIVGASFEQIGVTLTKQEINDAIQQCNDKLGG